MLKITFPKTSLFSPALLLILALGGSAHAETPSTTPGDPAQFARGAKTWANNCANCHNLRPASDLRDDQWRVVVAHMRIRADLTGQEARDVLKFLQEGN